MALRPFVVSACPASATKYTAALLTAIGVPCKHEHFFNMRKADWANPHLCGSSCGSPPYIPFLPQDTLILHQRRDPRNVIDSLVRMELLHNPTDGDRVWRDFFLSYCPIRPSTPEEMAAEFYVEWNRYIERQASTRTAIHPVEPSYISYRIEDADERFWTETAALIGVTVSRQTVREAIRSVPKNLNHHAGRGH